jgi:hypothetical protein
MHRFKTVIDQLKQHKVPTSACQYGRQVAAVHAGGMRAWPSSQRMDLRQTHPEEASIEQRQILHKRLLVVRAILISRRQVCVGRDDGGQLLCVQAEEVAEVAVVLGRHCQGAHLQATATKHQGQHD